MIHHRRSHRFTPITREGLRFCTFLLIAAPAWSASLPPASAFAVLEQPALASAKAPHQAMLAIARAGARLVAAGEQGIVLLSDDDGASWRQAKVPVSVSLTALHFVDARTGWAVGHLGTILRTGDGGETWVKQLDGIAAARAVLEDAEARLREGSGEGEAAERAVADARRLVEEGPDKPFLDVHFVDQRTGFALGAYNLMFRTDDAGRSWRPWQARVPNRQGLHLYGMAAAGGVLVVAGEQGLLLRSTDGGEHFEAVASPYRGSFFGVVAAADGRFVAYGLRGNAFGSADGGLTWQRADTGQGESLSAAALLADGRAALVSQAGDVVVSAERGLRFAPAPGLPRLPLAGVVQAADGALVAATLVGVHRLGWPQPRD